MWDLIVSVPDHCLSFYFSFMRYLLFLSFFRKIPVFDANNDDPDQMSHVMRKPVFRVCDQVRLKPACSAAEPT